MYIIVNIVVTHQSLLPARPAQLPLSTLYTTHPASRQTEIQRYRDTKIQRYRDTEIYRYRDTEIQRYRDTEIQKYRNTEIQKYRDTEICMYRNTEIQQNKKEYFTGRGEAPLLFM